MSLPRRSLIVLALVAALVLPGVARVGARQTHRAPSRLVHVVRQGETLWGIARRLAPATDARVTIDRLIAQNHLRDATIVPGQPLFLAVR